MATTGIVVWEADVWTSAWANATWFNDSAVPTPPSSSLRRSYEVASRRGSRPTLGFRNNTLTPSPVRRRHEVLPE